MRRIMRRRRADGNCQSFHKRCGGKLIKKKANRRTHIFTVTDMTKALNNIYDIFYSRRYYDEFNVLDRKSVV